MDDKPSMHRVYGAARPMHVITTTLLASLLVTTAASAAPAQLYNKSIVITWSESIQEKTPDGRSIVTAMSRERIAYVSSVGRVFLKSTQSVRSAQKKNEIAPGTSAGSLAFRGNTMVGTTVFAGFARRLTVSFDPGFTTCSVNVVYGRSGGPRTWKRVDGTQTLEVETINVGATSCSIREGNLVAG